MAHLRRMLVCAALLLLAISCVTRAPERAASAPAQTAGTPLPAPSPAAAAPTPKRPPGRVVTSLRPFAIPAGLPPTFLRYDRAAYRVFEREVEGVALEVAVSSAVPDGVLIGGFPASAAADFADLTAQLFAHHYRLFGGYPYERYRVVVRGPGEDPGVGPYSTRNVGLDITLLTYRLGSSERQVPPHGYTVPFVREWLAHEMLHAWNGQIIRPVPPPPGQIFQLETWFVEGITVYLTARSYDRAFYDQLMQRTWRSWERADPTLRRLPFPELAARVRPDPRRGYGPIPGAEADLLLWKGALVAYLLDLELRERGASLDALMQAMYERYGLPDRAYTNHDLRRMAEEVARADLGGFFRRFVTGDEALPLTGSFSHWP